MGAKESLSVDLAGIARLLQIVTCAQSATWLIAIIKGTRLSALTRDGAKGCTKLEARGLFKGAKAIRGPECEVNDQDGVPNLVGVVEEVVGSNDEDTKDSVRVSSKKRRAVEYL
ncbi:hypothetical protein P5673_017531 [Acropora cervicornis]|uniref:Uncharacterized protein n=1 Tax=Acropora cervicornis TaxID=6130 RepID=A0AAD9V3K1_ACRCE|nr:hypothetical protein P5673_017531 [Acropora cervicornis]